MQVIITWMKERVKYAHKQVHTEKTRSSIMSQFQILYGIVTLTLWFTNQLINFLQICKRYTMKFFFKKPLPLQLFHNYFCKILTIFDSIDKKIFELGQQFYVQSILSNSGLQITNHLTKNSIFNWNNFFNFFSLWV